MTINNTCGMTDYSIIFIIILESARTHSTTKCKRRKVLFIQFVVGCPLIENISFYSDLNHIYLTQYLVLLMTSTIPRSYKMYCKFYYHFLVRVLIKVPKEYIVLSLRLHICRKMEMKEMKWKLWPKTFVPFLCVKQQTNFLCERTRRKQRI